jgi:hypothetical protein
LGSDLISASLRPRATRLIGTRLIGNVEKVADKGRLSSGLSNLKYEFEYEFEYELEYEFAILIILIMNLKYEI